MNISNESPTATMRPFPSQFHYYFQRDVIYKTLTLERCSIAKRLYAYDDEAATVSFIECRVSIESFSCGSNFINLGGFRVCCADDGFFCLRFR